MSMFIVIVMHRSPIPTVSLQQGVQPHRQRDQRDPPRHDARRQAHDPGPPHCQAHPACADGGQGPGRRAVQRSDHILQPAGYWLVVSLSLAAVHCSMGSVDLKRRASVQPLQWIVE